MLPGGSANPGRKDLPVQAAHVRVDDRRYEVLGVKKGGMGLVWLLASTDRPSLDSVYRQRIAVKTFDAIEDQSAVERELNIWVGLSHRAIVPLLKIGRLDHRLCAIMPRCSRNLDEALSERGAIAETEVATLLEQVAQALSYVWREFNVLHLDLKPSNFLMDGDDIKVADWGISRLAVGKLASSASVTTWKRAATPADATAFSAGTPLFMAPERFSGRWVLSPAYFASLAQSV